MTDIETMHMPDRSSLIQFRKLIHRNWCGVGLGFGLGGELSHQGVAKVRRPMLCARDSSLLEQQLIEGARFGSGRVRGVAWVLRRGCNQNQHETSAGLMHVCERYA